MFVGMLPIINQKAAAAVSSLASSKAESRSDLSPSCSSSTSTNNVALSPSPSPTSFFPPVSVYSREQKELLDSIVAASAVAQRQQLGVPSRTKSSTVAPVPSMQQSLLQDKDVSLIQYLRKQQQRQGHEEQAAHLKQSNQYELLRQPQQMHEMKDISPTPSIEVAAAVAAATTTSDTGSSHDSKSQRPSKHLQQLQEAYFQALKNIKINTVPLGKGKHVRDNN